MINYFINAKLTALRRITIGVFSSSFIEADSRFAFVDDSDKEKIENMSNNIKRYGGNLAQKALNKYMDEQEELYRSRGDLSFKDYGSKLLFGKPLN